MKCSSLGVIFLPIILTTACKWGGSSSSRNTPPDNNNNETTRFTVSAIAGNGGSIAPTSVDVDNGGATSITITPDDGFEIDTVTGCGGTLEETIYTTDQVTADCTVTASFTSTAPFVAFTVSDDLAGTSSLFSVRKNGAELTNLTPDMMVGNEVERFSWAQEGARLIYLADQNIDDMIELFSVLPNGSEQATLSGALVLGGDVIDYKLSPDGLNIAYRANQDMADKVELYTVSVDGQNRVKINTPLVSGGNVDEYFWSPDGSHILYSADATADEQTELFIADIDRSETLKVNPSLNISDTIEAFMWSPNGTFISYVINDDLLVFDVVASVNTQLDGGITADVNEQGYVWSDNDAFLAVSEAVRPSAGNTGQVFILSADGSNTAIATLDIRHLTDHMIFIPKTTDLLVTSDSGGLVIGDTATLYRFSDAGVQLDRDDLIATDKSRDQVSKSLFSNDGEKVALYGIGSSWFYDLASGALNRFIDADSSGDAIETLAWSQDSTRLFYVPVIGDPSIISPDASNLVVLDDLTGIDTQSLQWVNNNLILTTLVGGTNGGGMVLKMDSFGDNRLTLGELPEDTLGVGVHNIGAYTVSDDGSFIVYDLQSSRIDNQGEALLSVNIDGTNTIRLNDELPINSGIDSYAISLQ